MLNIYNVDCKNTKNNLNHSIITISPLAEKGEYRRRAGLGMMVEYIHKIKTAKDFFRAFAPQTITQFFLFDNLLLNLLIIRIWVKKQLIAISFGEV